MEYIQIEKMSVTEAWQGIAYMIEFHGQILTLRESPQGHVAKNIDKAATIKLKKPQFKRDKIKIQR